MQNRPRYLACLAVFFVAVAALAQTTATLTGTATTGAGAGAPGLLLVTEVARDWRIVVLPDWDGARISPRCPLPTGVAMSMTRPITLSGPVSMRRRRRAARNQSASRISSCLALGRLGRA